MYKTQTAHLCITSFVEKFSHLIIYRGIVYVIDSTSLQKDVKEVAE